MSSMSSSNVHPSWAYLVEDVLQQIFLWSIIDSNKDFGRFGCFGSSLRILPQLAVSHVCSTWRQAALLTPRLWNRVYIRGISHPKTVIAKEWLSRARNTPVSIRGNASIGGNDVDEYCSSLLIFLSPYRIQDLDLLFDIFLPFLNLSARNVADLETLSISFIDACSGSVALNISQYPKLSHLSVSDNCTLSGTCNSLLKLYVIHCFLSVREFWDILSSSPLLEDVTVSVGHDDSGKSPITKDICPPHLRILHLIFSVENAPIPLASMIGPLSLRNLERFYITECPVDWSTPAFGALVRRSNGLSHLTSFSLNSPIVWVDAGAIISLIPSVTTLSLCTSTESAYKVRFDSDTLSRLANGSLGPQLKDISVGRLSNPQEFMDMVESRMEHARKCNDGTLMPFTQIWLDQEGCNESVLSHSRRLQIQGIPINEYLDEYYDWDLDEYYDWE